MITSTEIARGIHRISLYDEEDLIGKLTVPGASYNLFLIAGTQPAIINTMFRRTFGRLHARIIEILDPSPRYVISWFPTTKAIL